MCFMYFANHNNFFLFLIFVSFSFAIWLVCFVRLCVFLCMYMFFFVYLSVFVTVFLFCSIKESWKNPEHLKIVGKLSFLTGNILIRLMTKSDFSFLMFFLSIVDKVS